MNQTRILVETLKRVLRSQKITYADVARHLDLSEASVKRMFSRMTFTLDRLEKVCDLAGMPLAELVRESDQRPDPITMLTPEQERELLNDPKLLLVAFMVLNEWRPEQIVETFAVTEHEVIQRLAKLDRLGMIELLPGNRVRRLVARNFSWRPHGPVQKYFEREVRRDFLDSRFAKSDEHMRFVGGRLSHDSLIRMQQAINRITREFDELVQEDACLPHEEKIGVGSVFAIRPWELPTFTALRENVPNSG
ncbi:MAG: helix-turn-helix transcriptional regulator [Xanthomonadales bacterium]|nr:helix-turn-helix transcriptional regulator [Xanthomonadales bacterium]